MVLGIITNKYSTYANQKEYKVFTRKIFKENWPLVSITLIYWVIVAILIFISIENNQGHLIYPLDDTYIHMAIAKNASQNHIWGVTKYAFTSSTSSPLWTSLLTGMFLIFGVNDAMPLILIFLVLWHFWQLIYVPKILISAQDKFFLLYV